MQKRKLLWIFPRSTMRQRFVTLSSNGRKALARSLTRWREIQEEFVGRIGQKSWKSMQRQMERIAAAATVVLESSRGKTNGRPRFSRQELADRIA